MSSDKVLLFRRPIPRTRSDKGLEVHRHAIISGPRRGSGTEIAHSHEGGDTSHEHPHTGPSYYVIDKDDWSRETGMRGGGRKSYTKAPIGEQLPFIARTAEQNHFDVIIVGDPQPEMGTGPGLAPAERMALGFGMSYTVYDERRRPR